jgi:hypothetical protein
LSIIIAIAWCNCTRNFKFPKFIHWCRQFFTVDKFYFKRTFWLNIANIYFHGVRIVFINLRIGNLITFRLIFFIFLFGYLFFFYLTSNYFIIKDSFKTFKTRIRWNWKIKFSFNERVIFIKILLSYCGLSNWIININFIMNVM